MINITNILLTNNFAGEIRETLQCLVSWCGGVVWRGGVVVWWWRIEKPISPLELKISPSDYKHPIRVRVALGREYQLYHLQTPGWY